jgi:hypothetical protein
MKKISLLLASLGTLFAVIFVAPPVTTAAPAPSTPAPTTNPASVGQALEIAPPVVSVTADPGQTIRPLINIRNVSPSKLLVTGQVNDFTAAGEDGSPKLLLDPNENNPYSIRTWVTPLSKLTLESRKIVQLPVTITVPKDAAPGGYFGVIRFSASAPEIDSTGVSLSASLGALVFVRVNGVAKEGLSVASFSVSQNKKDGKLFEGAPVSFVERLKNTGNTYLQPQGQVIVKDTFGKIIGAVNVNLPPRNILPGSIRRFDQPFDKSVIGNKILFGRYTATMKLTYGDNKQSVEQTLSFWIIPYKLIAAVVIAIIALFFILRIGIRRYNESVVRRSRSRRR